MTKTWTIRKASEKSKYYIKKIALENNVSVGEALDIVVERSKQRAKK